MSLNTSLVALLALVPYGEDVDRARSVDFKQRYVSRGTKRNDEFSQKRIVRKRFTAGERRETQQPYRSFDRVQGVLCRSQVLFQQEVIKPQEIVFRLRCEANPIAFHRTKRRVASL